MRTLTNSGTVAERAILPSLAAGNYILRVSRAASNADPTNFSVNVLALADNGSNNEASPTDLGTLPNLPGVITRSNYVVAGGQSPVDFFTFRTGAARGFAQFDLTGPLSGGATSSPTSLFGDLDIDLYSAPQTADQGSTANTTGFASEVFSGTLAPNTTYGVRIRPKTGTTDGSAYNLRIGFADRNAAPSIVRDIVPGANSSDAKNFTAVGNLAYFSATTVNATGQQVSLWSSSGGTLNSTFRIADFPQDAELKEFTAVGSKLYFTARTTSGNELWTTDGTRVGTKQVADLNPGTGSSNPTDLTAVGNNLFFYTDIPSTGGTRASKRLYVLNSGTDSPQQLTSSLATDVTANPALTQLDLNSGSTFFTEVGDSALYFAAKDPNTTRFELYRAQVGAGSAVTIGQMILNPGTSSNPTGLVEVTDGGASKLYLVADTLKGSGEVVRIDSFNPGAYDEAQFTVFDLNGPANSANAAQLTYISQTQQLYFTADDTAAANPVGRELYRVSTIAAPGGSNPALVADINPGTTGSNPSNLTNVGGKLVFLAFDGTGTDSSANSLNLWVADSTGTVKMSSLASTNGRPLSNPDGTPFLTNIGAGSTAPFATVGNSFFFAGTNALIGNELRKITLGGGAGSNATTTVSGNDIFTGTSSSNPQDLLAIGSLIYFVADNGGTANGNEPWSIPG